MTEATVGISPNHGMPDDIDRSHPTYLSYIERTRAHYLATGFDNPYQWAHFQHVPFTPLRKPLAESRIGLITTAAEFDPTKGDQGPNAAYNNDAKFHAVFSRPTDTVPDLRVSHIGYDRRNAQVEDLNAYFPMQRLHEAVSAGRIGELASQFHAVPTLRSQRKTIERDAPEILERLREEEIDAAVLVAV
jgi:D-proline reductase (dithiol) PrdB